MAAGEGASPNGLNRRVSAADCVCFGCSHGRTSHGVPRCRSTPSKKVRADDALSRPPSRTAAKLGVTNREGFSKKGSVWWRAVGSAALCESHKKVAVWKLVQAPAWLEPRSGHRQKHRRVLDGHTIGHYKGVGWRFQVAAPSHVPAAGCVVGRRGVEHCKTCSGRSGRGQSWVLFAAGPVRRSRRSPRCICC